MRMDDQIVVVVGSEFARTPGYNGGNGKDHWPITSMIVMANGIDGNRRHGFCQGLQWQRGRRRFYPVF